MKNTTLTFPQLIANAAIRRNFYGDIIHPNTSFAIFGIEFETHIQDHRRTGVNIQKISFALLFKFSYHSLRIESAMLNFPNFTNNNKHKELLKPLATPSILNQLSNGELNITMLNTYAEYLTHHDSAFFIKSSEHASFPLLKRLMNLGYIFGVPNISTLTPLTRLEFYPDTSYQQKSTYALPNTPAMVALDGYQKFVHNIVLLQDLFLFRSNTYYKYKLCVAQALSGRGC